MLSLFVHYLLIEGTCTASNKFYSCWPKQNYVKHFQLGLKKREQARERDPMLKKVQKEKKERDRVSSLLNWSSLIIVLQVDPTNDWLILLMGS